MCVLIIFMIYSTKQSVMLQNLSPNTRYEFVVRLHVDQMSSPWSSVVYHQTMPTGNKSEITVASFIVFVFFSISHCCLHCVGSNQIIASFTANRVPLVLLFIANVIALPTAPSQPPTGVRVTLIEDDTALVSWREPAEPNVVVTHYTILYATQKAWMAGRWQIMQREGELFAGSSYLERQFWTNLQHF